ncbi:uncharacterized protein LOC128252786 [Drosophila gunungcola]|uniref:uncharacterized protein LOC128252786 n=1 Tax=Drosophila gunungcola TaxID=103775 RepID=UPI0022E0A712|nr:uncharacterized protein LOC128252786 [Drosophila gunungcola]
MDKTHKSDEAFDQSVSSSSRRVVWKLNDEEETFDSLVSYRRLPVQSRSQVTDVPDRKRTAGENWQLLLHDLDKKRAGVQEREVVKKTVNQKEPVWKANQSSATSLPEIKESSAKERAIVYWRRLFDGIHKRQNGADVQEDVVLTAKPSLALRYRPSHESLKFKRSKSTTRELVSDLKLESFSLPPQQTCVVREVEPKFAHRRRMTIANETDSCCSGELEVPKNSPVQDQEPGSRVRSELISVHVAAPTSSSFVEAVRRSTSARSRTVASKVSAAGTRSGSSPETVTAAGGKKCSSTSSASAGTTQLPTFRQRQQELHRYRVMVERRRLDLLELKIAREREEALHSEILFYKDLQIRGNAIKDNAFKLYEDNDCSNV